MLQTLETPLFAAGILFGLRDSPTRIYSYYPVTVMPKGRPSKRGSVAGRGRSLRSLPSRSAARAATSTAPTTTTSSAVLALPTLPSVVPSTGMPPSRPSPAISLSQLPISASLSEAATIQGLSFAQLLHLVSAQVRAEMASVVPTSSAATAGIQSDAVVSLVPQTLSQPSAVTAVTTVHAPTGQDFVLHTLGGHFRTWLIGLCTCIYHAMLCITGHYYIPPFLVHVWMLLGWHGHDIGYLLLRWRSSPNISGGSSQAS